MKQVKKVKATRWLALVALALAIVPAASALPGGQTAQGLKADGMRWNAIAKAYLGRHSLGSYPKGTVPRDTVNYPFATVQSGNETGIQVRYPFANENTQAFKDAEASASRQVISENSAGQSSPRPLTQPQSPSAKPGDGFDWSDAGIGAGVAALLASMLAVGVGTAVSRRRVAHA
jgi:hypothetical protein